MKTHTKQNAGAGIQKSGANTQHTPGPWAVMVLNNGSYNIKGDKDEHRKANARLIAAAPELLAALELANMLLIEYLPKEKPATNHNLRHIQDAIAKATGK